MATQDDDRLEADVPALALKALKEAQQRAAQAGHTRVLVRDGRLVSIRNGTITLLKQLPPRKKLTVRSKRISS